MRGRGTFVTPDHLAHQRGGLGGAAAASDVHPLLVLNVTVVVGFHVGAFIQIDVVGVAAAGIAT